MTRVLALADQSKIGSTPQRRFATAGTETLHNGVPLWTETACRFQPKPPAGLNRNRLSETPKFAVQHFHPLRGPACAAHRWPAQAVGAGADRCDLVSSSVFGSRIAPWQSPTDRDRPLPEWPTFRPGYLFACFRPTRLSRSWLSTGFTSRRNITKATARISHQTI
jgi:hypothetical protein